MNVKDKKSLISLLTGLYLLLVLVSPFNPAFCAEIIADAGQKTGSDYCCCQTPEDSHADSECGCIKLSPVKTGPNSAVIQQNSIELEKITHIYTYSCNINIFEKIKNQKIKLKPNLAVNYPEILRTVILLN